MKDIIKTIIALFFILGALFIGKYWGTEKGKSEINILKKNKLVLEKQIIEKDSILEKMNIEISNCKDSLLEMTEKQGITKNIVHLADSVKNKDDTNK